MRHRQHAAVLAALIALAGLISGCGPDTPAQAPVTAGPELFSVAGIPVEMLERANLEVLWDIQAPMLRGRRIEQLFYRSAMVYTIDSANVLTGIDARTGIIQWTAILGNDIEGCSPPAFYGDSLLFVVGNTFVQVDQASGEIIHRLTPRFPISTQAARNEELVFLGSSNGRFYALEAETGLIEWQSLMEAPPRGSVTLQGEMVYFATENDRLYVSRMSERDLVWQLEAQGDVPGAVIAGDQCLVPSADTTLYCLDPETGVQKWAYLSGGVLEELPVVTAEAIYQPIRGKSLLCLNRRDDLPRVRWELTDGRAMLSEYAGRTYAITRDGNLTIMDNRTNERVLAFFIPNRPLAAHNTEDSLIVLGSRDGQVLALRPRGAPVGQGPVAPLPEVETVETPAGQAPTTPGPGARTEGPLVVDFASGVGPVQYGMTREQVTGIMGQPDPASDEQRAIYLQQGLSIAFDETGRIDGFQVGGQVPDEQAREMPWQFRTVEGVALWAPAETVIQTYGEPGFQNEGMIAYAELGAYFRLTDGQVSSVLLRQPQ